MRPHSLLIIIALAAFAVGPGCTELNPTYDPNKDWSKIDTGTGQLDGMVPWQDHKVPFDMSSPLPERDPSCPPGQHRCGKDCVNLQGDPNNCGKCGNRCSGGTVCKVGTCCPPNMTNCGGVCADLYGDPGHCGQCNKKCKKDEDCSGGLCCDKGEVNCNGKCVEVMDDDPNNCGGCGKKCPSGEKCDKGKCSGGGSTGKGCADGSDEQKFNKGMVGCSGRVWFSSRHTLCAKGFRVCKASEWVGNRGNTKPSNHYWTNDNLKYNGHSSSCWVSTASGKQCSGGKEPMRVCAGKVDSKLNYCNWTNCGYGKAQPNHFFGGCQGNPTAGSLCCPN